MLECLSAMSWVSGLIPRTVSRALPIPSALSLLPWHPAGNGQRWGPIYGFLLLLHPKEKNPIPRQRCKNEEPREQLICGYGCKHYSNVHTLPKQHLSQLI